MILSVKTLSSCGPTCVVYLKSFMFLKMKLSLFVGNSCMKYMLWKFFEFNLPVTFINFLSAFYTIN